MTFRNIDHEDTSAVPTPPDAQRTAPAAAAVEPMPHDRHAPSVSGPEYARRVVILAFGLVQIVIGARFVLRLLDAQESNSIVSGILDLSQLVVGPFEGILRTETLESGGSTFDATALVAIVGWTVLELIVIWAIGVFRRDRA